MQPGEGPVQTPTAHPAGPLGTEDVRKLHAEVNQIAGQRFVVMTVAVTVFGVIVSQMLPKDPSRVRETMPIVYLEQILLLSMLSILFRLSLLLRRSLQVFTAYLVVKGASQWEADWIKFRSTGFRPYTHAYTDLFLVLGAFATAIPFAIEWEYRILRKGQFGMMLALIFGALYLMMIWGVGRREWFSPQRNYVKEWERTLMPSDNDAPGNNLA